MKAAYAIFAREKAHNAPFVERQVRAAFAQTYPCEILLSDQGSTDGTRELLHRLAAEYAVEQEYRPPHHVVRLLDCPETALRGMAGLNAHLAWLQDQTDAEYFIHAAADDDADPERTAVLVEAFERTGADMVGAAMLFKDPAGKRPPGRSAFAREGWVSVGDMVEHKVGGSAAAGWRRDLWKRIAPYPVIGGPDVWMPPLAGVLGGFWYVNRPLYTYYHHADPRNTGLEGALIAAKDDAERRVIDEHRFFQNAASWQWVQRRMESLGVGTAQDRSWVQQCIVAHYEAWGDTRMTMTLNREPPQAFRI
jgi:glycosyltransferase involved in cell wall biosynthesis